MQPEIMQFGLAFKRYRQKIAGKIFEKHVSFSSEDFIPALGAIESG